MAMGIDIGFEPNESEDADDDDDVLVDVNDDARMAAPVSSRTRLFESTSTNLGTGSFFTARGSEWIATGGAPVWSCSRDRIQSIYSLL